MCQRWRHSQVWLDVEAPAKSAPRMPSNRVSFASSTLSDSPASLVSCSASAGVSTCALHRSEPPLVFRSCKKRRAVTPYALSLTPESAQANKHNLIQSIARNCSSLGHSSKKRKTSPPFEKQAALLPSINILSKKCFTNGRIARTAIASTVQTPNTVSCETLSCMDTYIKLGHRSTPLLSNRKLTEEKTSAPSEMQLNGTGCGERTKQGHNCKCTRQTAIFSLKQQLRLQSLEKVRKTDGGIFT